MWQNRTIMTINRSGQSDVYTHLIACKESFIPPLDSYVDIKDYSYKLFNYSTRIEVYIEDTLAGLAALYINKDRQSAYVTNFSVIPEYQRQGIAGRLLEMSKEYVVANKLTFLDLDVFLVNHRAVSFYKRHGFIEVEKDDIKLKARWLKQE